MTFTKEQLIASAHSRIEFSEMMLADNPEPLKERTWSIELELARMALAALESRADAEPVGFRWRWVDAGEGPGEWWYHDTKHFDVVSRDKNRECQLIYTRPQPAPVVPDDTRRMDWLVSKTVNVREPLVYGSRDLFWSQTITDEEDEKHATKLREQIDAAILAAAPAPGKEG